MLGDLPPVLPAAPAPALPRDLPPVLPTAPAPALPGDLPPVLPAAPASVLPGDLPSAMPETAAFHPSEIISPLTLAAATRSVYDLIAATPARGRVRYPRIEEALTNSAWQRQGIYLYCRADEYTYAEVFKHFLEQGFLIPPNQNQPLILPGVLSAGEETKLAGAFHGKQ
jgi:hypothetical protein